MKKTKNLEMEIVTDGIEEMQKNNLFESLHKAVLKIIEVMFLKEFIK